MPPKPGCVQRLEVFVPASGDEEGVLEGRKEVGDVVAYLFMRKERRAVGYCVPEVRSVRENLVWNKSNAESCATNQAVGSHETEPGKVTEN